jgi:endonuclease/exonuclease/phosphatase family metal-dependent hydrolase
MTTTTVRIATYNLWWAIENQQARLDAAAELLDSLDADVIALQEVGVRGPFAWETLQTRYTHAAFRPEAAGDDEGLGIISKHPLRNVVIGDDPAIRCSVDIDRVAFNLTNVHLDWQRVANREAQIVRVVEQGAASAGYELLVGDFNSYPESSVYRFLTGQQSLLGTSTIPFHDLPLVHARRSGTEPLPTLDFWRNPRWTNNPKLEIPARCDWILLRDTFEHQLPYPRLIDADLFGVEPSSRHGVVPSDHYGVVVDLEF